jgi:hypothetical protein
VRAVVIGQEMASCFLEPPEISIFWSGRALEVVQRIFPHEQFDYRAQSNDVAVLQLATNYGGDRWIPIADAEADEKLTSPGQTVAIAGWGMTWDYKLVAEEAFSEKHRGRFSVRPSCGKSKFESSIAIAAK